MPKNLVEVITLSSSDEDSNPTVETTRNVAKPQKITARKSLHTNATIRNPTIKEEPPPMVSTPTKGKMATVNNVQFNSTKPSATTSEHLILQKKSARKSLLNSNSQSVPKVVSTSTTSSNLATVTSKSRTVTASGKLSVSKTVANAAAKMPGITITPLATSKTVVKPTKVLSTAQNNCGPKSAVNLNKHFKPTATSTPIICNNLNTVNTNHVKTESKKLFNSKGPIATSKATTEAQAPLSMSKLAKTLPDVSISPLGESVRLSPSERSTSLLVSLLGKTGVTLTKNAVNGKILETLTSTDKQKVNLVNAGMTKEKLSNNFVPVVKTGVTITKTAENGKVWVTPTTTSDKQKVNAGPTNRKTPNSFVSINKLFEGSKTSTKSMISKNSVTKQATKELSIGSITAKPVTSVGQVNKQIKLQNDTKVIHTSVLPTPRVISNSIDKRKKLDKIISSPSACTQVKDNYSKLHNFATSKQYIPILPKLIHQENKPINGKSVSDSLAALKSKSAVTILPVSEVAKNSKNGPTQKFSSQNVKDASKKRSLPESDSYNNVTNKKAKLDQKPLFNGTHANLATVEENMKRISALKESLKKIAANSPKSMEHSKESSNSRINGLVENTKTGRLAKDLGSKDSRYFTEKLPTKNLNSEETKSVSNSKNCLKKDKNEKPFKQVTSPKLSLKRKQVDGARVIQNSSSKAIPLGYSPIQSSAKKAKLDSNGPSVMIIPMGWKTTEEKHEANGSEPNREICKSPANNASPPPQISVPLSVASQKDTTGNVAVWDQSDSNATKFKKLLEFSKSFMNATLEEKCTIVNNFHKLFNKADSSYVESSEFSSLMDSTIDKIKDSKDTFIHLQNVKTELKAYKKRKNSTTPLKPRRLSSSSELSEAISVASNLEIPSDDPPKQVPTPNLADKLASAILTNFKQKEPTGQSVNNDAANAFHSVPCTSKQADIIENLRLSMPVSNGVKPSGEFRDKPSSTQSVVDKQSMSNTTTNHTLSTNYAVGKMANPVQLPPDCEPEIEVVNEVVTAAQKDALLEKLNLQSVDRQNAHLVKPNTVQNEQKANDLYSIPVKEGINQPKTSTIINTENAGPVKTNTVQSKEQVSNLLPMSVKEDVDEPKSSKSKIERRVKLLETHLGQLDKKIKKLQSKELSLDDLDDEDSTYIMEDRYKKKFQKTWLTLCKLKKRSQLVGREIDKRFTYEGSRHAAFNKAIEKLVNKKKTTEKFPNYVEVYNLLQKVNDDAHLSLSSYEIDSAAREAFEDIGTELKRRRRTDLDRDFGCYLTDNIQLETDPAEHDEELNKKLKDSVLEGEKKIAAIIEKFAAQHREDPNAETADGSNCEDDDNEGEMDVDPPIASQTEAKVTTVKQEDSITKGSLEEPVGIFVTAKSYEDTDLPDTAPATPETDEREDNATPPISIARPTSDVIDIDSSSSGSTDPGPNANERQSSSFVADIGSRIYISDVIEIEPPEKYDDSSPDLPSLAELCGT